MYLLADSRRRTGSRRSRRWTGSATPCSSSGGPDLWNVHVHVDDVGAALEAGVAAGRPHRVRVTHFADQRRGRPSRPPRWPSWPARPATGWPRSSGLRGRRSSAAAPAGGPRRGRSSRRSARSTRSPSSCCPTTATPSWPPRPRPTRPPQEGIDLHVVRSRTAVQGIAALAVFDPAGVRRQEPRGDEQRGGRHPARRGHRGQPRGADHRRAVPTAATSSASSTATSSWSAATWLAVGGGGGRAAALQRRRAADRRGRRGRPGTASADDVAARLAPRPPGRRGQPSSTAGSRTYPLLLGVE